MVLDGMRTYRPLVGVRMPRKIVDSLEASGPRVLSDSQKRLLMDTATVGLTTLGRGSNVRSSDS